MNKEKGLKDNHGGDHLFSFVILIVYVSKAYERSIVVGGSYTKNTDEDVVCDVEGVHLSYYNFVDPWLFMV